MKLVALLVVLGLITPGRAIMCYNCKSPRPMDDVSHLGTALSFLINAPSCGEFDPQNEDWNKKFIKNCPGDGACLKVTDPKDSTNEARGCFLTANDGCGNGTCFCVKDLCNGAGCGLPSFVPLLLTALAAALVGGH